MGSLRKVLSFIQVPIAQGHLLESLDEIDSMVLKRGIHTYC